MRIREAEVSFEDFVRARSSSLLRTALLLAGQNRAEAEDPARESDCDPQRRRATAGGSATESAASCPQYVDRVGDPDTALSSTDFEDFSWQNGGHRLIVTSGPQSEPGPDQIAYWQAGDAHIYLATIRNLGEIAEIETGAIG